MRLSSASGLATHESPPDATTRSSRIASAASEEAPMDPAGANSLPEPDLDDHEHLWRALSGAHPFRRFKDAVAWERAVEEQWFRFHDGRQTARAIA
jgi:hypothetical protein